MGPVAEGRKGQGLEWQEHLWTQMRREEEDGAEDAQ